MGAEGKDEDGAQVGSPILLAIDTGGTFTDVVALTGSTLTTLKVPSTPGDPADAVLKGLGAALPPDSTFDLMHGSTVATNALLERRGARVLLVTNEGFQDVIEIGRQDRPQLYALQGHRPPPLVAREDRVGIHGRMGPDGVEIEPLNAEELAKLGERVAAAEAVAVCLLHAYANPAHEEEVARALAHLDVSVSVSSRILPEFREFERTATTVVNAYVAPVMAAYLRRLDAEAGARTLRVMGSGGGALPVERAASEPVQTVLSGPAGGVVGALDWARRAGFEGILTFDMGGTSTDVSLCPGRILQTREFEIASTPVALPVIDIHTVGAGGGSLARVDAGGALKVGPESAGAVPGPICYGRGGTRPTVTDAHVWLGRLPAQGFLGGSAELDRAAIGPALEELAREAGSTPDAVAEGIVEVANTSMERALRVISVERGQDPGDFILVGFGGAGGLHVAELAERLGAAGVLIPPNPGLLSAYGMLVAPVIREESRTVLLDTDQEGSLDRVTEILEQLGQEAVGRLEAEGFHPERLESSRWVEARYRGQSFELRVPAEDWIEGFHQAHRVRYGYDRRDSPVQAVTLRAVASAPGAEVAVPPIDRHPVGPVASDSTTVHWHGRNLEAALVWRRDLGAGASLRGPAVILEYSSTTWLPPGWTLEVDPWGSLHLRPHG